MYEYKLIETQEISRRILRLKEENGVSGKELGRALMFLFRRLINGYMGKGYRT